MKRGNILILKSGIIVSFLEYSKKEELVWVQIIEDCFGRIQDLSWPMYIDKIAEII